jgi:hypothetical protein
MTKKPVHLLRQALTLALGHEKVAALKDMRLVQSEKDDGENTVVDLEYYT